MTIRFVIPACLILLFAPVKKNLTQSAQWKGKVEIIEGIKTVRNPGEPLYGEFTFNLEEDLSIGRADDEHYIFGGTVGIESDSRGNILVFDFQAAHIRKFDKNGAYLQTIGRKGQGPGEFDWSMFYILQTDFHDNIYVKSYTGVSVFDEAGKFLRSVKFRAPNGGLYFGMTKQGNIMTRSSDFKNKLVNVVLINPGGEIFKTVDTFLSEFNRPVPGQIDLGNHFNPELCLCWLSDDRVVYGFSNQYQLTVVSLAGEKVLRIEKEEPPVRLTKNGRNQFIESYIKYYEEIKRPGSPELSRNDLERDSRFPEDLPYYHRIIQDDRGRIYAARFQPPHQRVKTGGDYDIFSREGIYLCRAKIDVPIPIIKNGYAYAWVYDEESTLMLVKRYKIKNWDRLKDGI